jgi:hypothetical protein
VIFPANPTEVFTKPDQSGTRRVRRQNRARNLATAAQRNVLEMLQVTPLSQTIPLA